MATTVDVEELEAKVKDMYRHVAEEPHGSYHFELGRSLAEHLGYPASVLDRIPDPSIESFAGVGYFFDLADLSEGESVIDLGSGSGMDVFFAAAQVGAGGRSSESTSLTRSSRRPAGSRGTVGSHRSTSAKGGSRASTPRTRASIV